MIICLQVAWELEKAVVYHCISLHPQRLLNQEAVMARQGLEPHSRWTKIFEILKNYLHKLSPAGRCGRLGGTERATWCTSPTSWWSL